MDACSVNARITNVAESFDEIYEAMQDDKYWIRFFVRPCCPAPSPDVAIDRLDKLKAEVDARQDFTSEQKHKIFDVIEARKAWYPTSGLCRVHRSSMAVS